METAKVKTHYGEIEVIDNDHIGEIFKSGKYYEMEYINICLLNNPKRRNVALDIGANIGSYTLPLALNFKSVVAFEPQPKLNALLKKNVSHNVLLNTEVKDFALGHYSGTTCMEMGKCPENYGSISIGTTGDVIKIKTLDALGYKNVDFIKIDVEGAEKLVLFGGRETIKKNRPYIFFEHTNIKEFLDRFHIEDAEIREWNLFEFLFNECGYDRIVKFSKNYLAIP